MFNTEEMAKSQKLTPARAILLTMLYRYRALGEEASEFAAEKLSYFLQRFGETQLKLDFAQSHYGPYSGKVRHVLYALNGFYLKGFEQKQAQPFEPLELVVAQKSRVDAYVNQHLGTVEKERLARVGEFISGFESPYGLELLATVDFAINKLGRDDFDQVSDYISNWSHRKANLFTEAHLALAIDHIRSATFTA